jgi:stress-induced morphogen
MDQNKISSLVGSILNGLDHQTHQIFFEADDVLRIEVVSDVFRGHRLLKRIDMLTCLFRNSLNQELFEYHLIFNPLTMNEKNHGIKETDFAV